MQKSTYYNLCFDAFTTQWHTLTMCSGHLICSGRATKACNMISINQQ